MREKNDFITNSSSVNFIITTPRRDEHSAKIKITLEVDLIDYVRLVIKDDNSFQEFLKDWGYIGYEEEEERVIQIRKALDRGENVFIIDASDEDSDPIETLLCHKGIVGDHVEVPDDIKILEGQGGY